jgi:CelD/BcsL family acetyltransferase involved in cellulose biosynthesis
MQRAQGRGQVSALAIEGGPSSSLGLFDADRLVGYVLARLPQPADSAVQLSDWAVRERYRECVPELVARWFDRVHELCPHRALEIEPAAACAPHADQGIAALRDLGFAPAAGEASAPAAGSGSLHLVRTAGASADPRALPVLASFAIAGRSYEVRVVRSGIAWDSLEPFWDALLERTPGATGFQSFDVLRAWWRCYGQAARLWIGTIWRDGELCGIAPLQVSAVRSLRGWLGTQRKLEWIGAIYLTHRPTFLFGESGEACSEVWMRLLERGDAPWDVLYLHGQLPDAPVLGRLRELAGRRRYLLRTEPDLASPYVSRDRSFDEFFAERSRMHRQNVRSAQRKLEGMGALRFELVSQDGPRLREALERYRELEGRSWKSRHDFSTGGSARRAYYDELLRVLGPKRRIQLAFLRLRERPLAGAIAVIHGRHYYHLEITYDAEFARYSPGTVLEYLELQEFFAGPYTEYDFLGGGLEHKQRWTGQLRELVQVHVARSPGAVLGYYWLKRVRPWLGSLAARAAARRARSPVTPDSQ